MALDKEEVAERLRELRGAKPQQVIADAVGVTLRAYQAWEGAESGMHWENLERLAEVFGVSENFLLYGLDERPQPGEVSQLDRIERMLVDLDEHIRQLMVAVIGRVEELPRSPQEAVTSPASRRRRRPAASA